MNYKISSKEVFIDTNNKFCQHDQESPDINRLIALQKYSSDQSILGFRSNGSIHQCHQCINNNFYASLVRFFPFDLKERFIEVMCPFLNTDNHFRQQIKQSSNSLIDSFS